MDERQPIVPIGHDAEARRPPRALHPPTFGDLLVRYRLASDLTQEELAARATLSVRALNYLEHGTTRPQKETVRLLTEALGLSPEQRAEFARAALGREAAVPPLAPLAPTPTNLPALITALIGREAEVAEIAALLRGYETRLVTVMGPGGIGKTRLALAVALQCLAEYPEGVYFVSLVGLRDATLVMPTIAQTVGLHEQRGATAFDILCAALAAKRLLLILDNCEHLTDAAPEIARLLAACPKIGVLVTSRAALRLRGEREYPLGPLALPAAVTLFNERARTINPALATTDPEAVREICTRLEGLPLAIELAAARVRVLSAREVRARLDNRLALLTRGPRDLPHRHQTMRGAIAWSHDLLTREERLLFRRLAVFAGGWTIAAAEAVCASDDLPLDTVLDRSESLVDQSLVRAAAASEGTPRLEMFEAIREFALERLEESGEREELERRHARYALSLAHQLDLYMQGIAQAAARETFKAERDNLRAALVWARAHSETTIGLGLAGALGRCWDMAAQYHEGRAWLETFLAAPRSDAPAARVRALNAAAALARKQGDYADVIARARESLDLARAHGDSAGAAQALSNLGLARYRQGDHDQAVVALEESVALRRELGDAFGLSGILNNLAQVMEERGEYERALALYEESLLLKRGFDDRWNMGVTLNNLGDLARSMGDQARAIACSEEGMAIGHETGDTRIVANALRNLGLVARDRRDYARAGALFAEALALKRDLGDKRGVSSLLGYLGEVHRLIGEETQAAACFAESMTLCRAIHNWKTLAECLEGVARLSDVARDPARAARLLGWSAAMRARMGTPIPPVVREEQAGARAALQDVLGTDSFAAAWEAGASLSPDEAIKEASPDGKMSVPRGDA